jgi:RNA polymerase sigma-70 factor (ECF subfamily)
MTTTYPLSPESERGLLEAARGGDGDAYGRLVEARRGELLAHCYRMLGSVQDAEDALQEALLRGWRGLRGFDGRSSLRSWLYRIATNTCLDTIAGRKARALPVAHAPAAAAGEAPALPVAESAFIEPFPDDALGVPDGLASPEARYERRESVELAFVAAMQHLPARQRAVLILRDVLAFSAKETSETLGTTVASANSALQRARQRLDDELPDRSQQAALRALGDDGVRDLVERYTGALQRGDVDGVVALLTEDATWSMPPVPTWYRGEALRGFLSGPARSVRWRHVPTRASGQLAVGCYAWDATTGDFVASVLDVLTLRDGRIAAVDGFSTAASFRRLVADGPPYTPSAIFGRFGLPERLPGDDR